jgi:hypothetical protein
MLGGMKTSFSFSSIFAAVLLALLTACDGTPQAQDRGSASTVAPGGAETAFRFQSASTLTHGSQLTRSMVGPEGLGLSAAQLRQVNVNDERIGTWPSDGIPSWIPSTPYVYNNDPSNHGGVVPAGGMIIDGFTVPAGVWVAQFDDFGGQSIIINGDNAGTSPHLPGVVFRGCRWRGAIGAPGFLNIYQGSHTNVWLLYNDAGGLGAADSQYNEVPFQFTDASTNGVFARNYISYTTTGILVNQAAPQIIENFIEKITLYYNDAPPPGESTGKHLNGIKLHGGHTNTLVLRNKVLLQSPDDAGRTIGQTDAIGLFQYAGTFSPGTGINLDGSKGYQIRDNYVGGAGYSFYAGQNAGTAASTCQNVVFSGNQITTQWWPQGGYFGAVSAEPAWGSLGNQALNNTWADGAKAGQLAFGSSGSTPTPTPTPTPAPNPTPAPAPTPAPSPAPAPSQQSLFTTQVPAKLKNSDGVGVNYELGMRFQANVPGQIKAIRFYKSPYETGTHTGRIFSASGTVLARVSFVNEKASGWVVQALSTPLSIKANTEYVVSVNTGGTYYVNTNSGFASVIKNGNLTSAAGAAGVFGKVGALPTQSYMNSNYFRDLVFVPK